MQETVQAARNQIHKVTNTKKKRFVRRENPKLLSRRYLSILQTTAAKSPPIIGATQNSQSWLNAVLSANS